MNKPDRSVYTSLDLLGWHEAGTLAISPKFQRRGVWTLAARSFFIDTLIRGMPVPPIYIRITQSSERNRVVREIVDGQQRVSAVLDFVAGKYRLAKTLPATWSGKNFSDLSEEDKQRIRTFAFSAEIFQDISDLEVLEVFARLNTYSVPLNAQELRNGRYFGLFKQTAYSLSYDHLEFWRRHKIFTERKIARMAEAELTSELVIASMAGMQDKKTTVDKFYAEYDEEFKGQALVEKRFRNVIDAIEESFDNDLNDTEFSRSPLFYTLYCAVFHRQWGLPQVKLETPRKLMTAAEQKQLAISCYELSELIQKARDDEDIPSRHRAFVGACLRQTDNIAPRRLRLETLYKSSFGLNA